MKVVLCWAALLAATVQAAPAAGQRAGSGQLAAAIDAIGVNTRVLMIGAHPDDEDTQLITWLARGRHVETAYLSLTRGDGGQNLIGNELGEALGAIRTQELLAARRLDGGRQYFTRAFDFGFSRTATETFTKWNRDSILLDVVTAVRAFRPHVIVSVFSGTAADGHGHHQVAGLLAREAWDVSADTTGFPVAASRGHLPWTVAKFYRSASFRNQERATIRINAGEFDPIDGRSWAEVAAVSRSQHRSQGFGSLQPVGPRFVQLQREASRVNDVQEARSESHIFAGLDSTWARFRGVVSGEARTALARLPAELEAARIAFDLRRPDASIPSLVILQRTLAAICSAQCTSTDPDLERSVQVARRRVGQALAIAAGVVVLATTPAELNARGTPFPVTVAVHNRGRLAVTITGRSISGATASGATVARYPRPVASDSSLVDTLPVVTADSAQPWWLRTPRRGVAGGAMFSSGGGAGDESAAAGAPVVELHFSVGGGAFDIASTVVRRYADPVRGEVNAPVASVPSITLRFDDAVEYAQAHRPLSRAYRVHVTSHAPGRRLVDARLSAAGGLTTSQPVQRVEFQEAGETRTVTFEVSGTPRPGRHRLVATASTAGVEYTSGFTEVAYDHIATQRLFSPAVLEVEAVDIVVPTFLTVGYINGVGDNSAGALARLGIPVTMIDPAELPALDLSRFTAIVVGTRAYESSSELRKNNQLLREYARAGGTVVAQYGQYEMTEPGILPWPITLARPADRVTVEESPVRLLDPANQLLATPNRISLTDFDGWQQDRSLYMPRTFDERYTPVVEVGDPGEPPNRGSILIAPIGRGAWVYTSLAFFRQLPVGVPGAARLFVNLLAARGPGRAQ
ncbi:MAG: PIG-L family deacetylase [Gemmatimonadota bacterium]